MAAGLFGSALCALVIFGITAANKPERTSTVAFAPANSGAMAANQNDSVAFSAAAF